MITLITFRFVESLERIVWYLKWSLSIRLLPAQIQLPQNGQTNKEPVAEAIVVDQPEDVLYTQVYQGHDALQRHTEIHE